MSSHARRLLTRPLSQPLERLEGREVPDATLLTSTADSRLAALLAAGNGPSQVIGTDANGDTVLIQSQATNLVTGQNTPPLQTNLFVYTLQGGGLTMVAPGGFNQSPVDFGGVTPSTPGVKLTALLSDDGSTVVFTSSANAGRLDTAFNGDLSRDGGGDDIFTYSVSTGNITLVSRDYNGQAIGGSATVSNPAISATGGVVSFVTTMDANQVTGKNFFLDGFSFPDTNNQYFFDTLPTVSTPGSPDLFRAVPGQTPDPVSYDELRNYSLTTTADNLYVMDGDVQVDPLGRYMTGGGVGFTLLRTRPALVPSSFLTTISNPLGIPGLLFSPFASQLGTDGIWRYAFTPSQAPADNSGNKDPVDRTQLLTNSVTPDTNLGSKLVPLGSISNVSVARESGQVMFDYKPLRSDNVRPNINSFSFTRVVPVAGTDDTFVPRLVTPVSTGSTVAATVASELYRYDFTNNKYVMVTASSKTANADGASYTYTAANGQVDLSPGNYGQSFNGTRIVFTSKATDYVPTAKASKLNTVAVDAAAGSNNFLQVYQLDTQDQGQKDTSLNDPTQQVDLNPIRLLSYGFDQNKSLYTFGSGDSTYPTQINDSLAVAFLSAAPDLFLNNPTTSSTVTNGSNDYLWERVAPLGPPRLSLVSVGADGSQANGQSFGPPVLSGAYNKLTVFFTTGATNLSETPFTPGLGQQVFFRDFPQQRTTATNSVVLSGGNGSVVIGSLTTTGSIGSTTTYQPFGASWTGEVRVALADVNGDGVPDIICGVGPGGSPRVVVLNGYTGRVIMDFFAFETRFTGGVYVAGADLNGDGRADLVIGAGEGGGPRVQIVDGRTNRILMDTFVYESTFRGGARVATGDVNGDGTPDLVTGAGIGGGPRVSVFDGASLPRLVTLANFFAYEPTLRGGAYVSAGDYNGDGFADIVTGAGPDGGPRVTVFNGANLNFDPNKPTTFVDFYAFDPNSRTGARPVLKNINNDLTADLVVGTGGGYPLVRTFNGALTTAGTGEAQPLQTLNPFTGSVTLSGAWVG